MAKLIRELDEVELATMRQLAGRAGSEYLDSLVRLADGIDCDRADLIHTAIKSLCKTVGEISFETYETTELAE